MSRNIALPDELVKRAEVLAAREHMSVEDYVAARLQEHLRQLEYLHLRSQQGSREKFERALAQVPAVEPEAHDRL